ncbi:hypothetical protein KO361_00690 [Candidatus Woesearchaeota archaeon]|nr:hypothetical protein [Candidatus Woesearchaeota archaeon]
MSNLRNVVSGLLIGGVVGYFVAKNNQPLYTLSEKNNINYLFSKNVKKAYELNEFSDNFYLGGVDHNLNGVRDLAYFQGFSFKEKELLIEKQRCDSLDIILEDSLDKLDKLRKIDKLDDIGEKINQGYQYLRLKMRDLKKKMLE